MRKLAPLGLLVLLAGCQPSPEKQVEGNWKISEVKLSPAAEKLPGSAAIKKSLLESTLEVKADKSYTMSQMGQPIVGAWTIETRTLNLTTKSVGGKSIEELKAMAKAVGMEKSLDALSKPMLLTLSDDGKKLTGDQNGTKFELSKADAK